MRYEAYSAKTQTCNINKLLDMKVKSVKERILGPVLVRY